MKTGLLFFLATTLTLFLLSGCGGKTTSDTGGGPPVASQPSVPVVVVPGGGGKVTPAAINMSAQIIPYNIPVGATFVPTWTVDFISNTDFYTIRFYITHQSVLDSSAMLIYQTSGGTVGGANPLKTGSVSITRKATNVFTVPNYGDIVTTGLVDSATHVENGIVVTDTDMVSGIIEACISEVDSNGKPICTTYVKPLQNVPGGVFL